MMNFTDPNEVAQILEDLCLRWRSEVLSGLHLLAEDDKTSPSDYLFRGKKEKVLAYGFDRLSALSTEVEDLQQRKEMVFVALHDFLNVYNREVLDPAGVLRSDYKGNLQHPYYAKRRQFISESVDVLI